MNIDKEVERLFTKMEAAEWITGDGERVMLTRAECRALIELGMSSSLVDASPDDIEKYLNS